MFLMGDVKIKFLGTKQYILLFKVIHGVVVFYSTVFYKHKHLKKVFRFSQRIFWSAYCMYIWLRKKLYTSYVIMHNFTLYITRCKNYPKFCFHLPLTVANYFVSSKKFQQIIPKEIFKILAYIHSFWF